MSFDSKFYLMAENELNNRRTRNERLLTASEREIQEKHPDVYEIHRKVSTAGARIIELVMNRDPDVKAKMAVIEEENLQLQEKLKQALVRKGYAPDFLEMQYTCKLCKDTGVLNGRRCQCFMEVVKREAANELNQSSPMQLSDFNDFSLSYYDDKQLTSYGVTAREIMADNLDFCRTYAADFHLPCNGIVMKGGTGLGKTHLSLSIAKEVIGKGYSVIYGSAPDLFRKAEQEQFGRSDGNTIDMLLDVDLLILDDVGAEFESKFYNSVLYNIVNNRMNAARPTIISTNMDFGELLARYGERIVSRLKTMDDLTFVGTDIRFLRRGAVPSGGIK